MNNSIIQHNKYICEYCGKNHYIIYNDSKSNNSYIKCYESPEGYYLDENELSYKLCYKSCKSCNLGGNEFEHNCIKCNENYFYKLNK